jgi:hypothetical protein
VLHCVLEVIAMKNTQLALLLLAIFALAVAFLSLSRDDDGRARSTRPASTAATLSSGSGSGNEVSRDFDVPNGCNRQELSYRGTQTAASGGFINFRVYDDTGFPAGSVGPIDLDEEQSGSALWTLDAGTTYSIEVTADGAEWSYTLKCR